MSRPPRNPLPRLPRLTAGLVVAALVLAVLVVGLVKAVTHHDPRTPSSVIAGDDPASRACRGLSDEVGSSCVAAYFQCHDGVHKILVDTDIDDRLQRDPHDFSRAYVRTYWADWQPTVRRAVDVGCRAGFRRDPTNGG